jgi:hypothetical protein
MTVVATATPITDALQPREAWNSPGEGSHVRQVIDNVAHAFLDLQPKRTFSQH